MLRLCLKRQICAIKETPRHRVKGKTIGNRCIIGGRGEDRGKHRFASDIGLWQTFPNHDGPEHNSINNMSTATSKNVRNAPRQMTMSFFTSANSAFQVDRGQLRR